MTITATSLRNPATKQKIRKAMTHAFFQSAALQGRLLRNSSGLGCVRNKHGTTFIRAWHYRDNSLPTKGHFVFRDESDNDITPVVLKALRERSIVPSLLREQAA